jgi:hypothetical protein
VVAIVYKRTADFPNIEYIEDQWPKKRWVNRLWYEYVSMKKISKELAPVDLWLSLHDTTPNVLAEKQAVYCHNPFPFYEWKWRECLFAPQIVLLSLFSKFIYKKNINKNTFVIVQQQWLKDEFKKLFKLKSDKIIVALPDAPKSEDMNVSIKKILILFMNLYMQLHQIAIKILNVFAMLLKFWKMRELIILKLI